MILKGYVTYHKPCTIDNMGTVHGSVSMLVKNDSPQSLVGVNMPLQMSFVKVTF